jgi:alkylation response protein AidB-like acyl-CoA dehydrogenase
VVQAALRPGPSSLRAHARGDGWSFEGDALWVSGWGLVDTFFTAARAVENGRDDTVVWALLDAADGSLSATPQELVAANASRTVAVHFDDVFVPADRVVGVAPLQPTGPDALRVNGALALGVARRCLVLLEEAPGAGSSGARDAGGVGNAGSAGGRGAGSHGTSRAGGPGGSSAGAGSHPAGAGDFAAGLSALRAEMEACRAEMDNAADVAGARAHAADLALRLAATLVVKQGARSILRDQHAQRLMREATFLLVFGTRAPIQQALLGRLMG